MNEFEAACAAQNGWRKGRAAVRREGLYLNSKLKDFPGVVPQKLYDGDSGAFYLYMTAYHKEHFNNVPRATFLKALAAEGISLSTYLPQGLHKESWTKNILNEKVYTKMFTPERLKKFSDELIYPNVENLLENVMMIWASGPLLGTKEDMDDIINAIMKIYDNRETGIYLIIKANYIDAKTTASAAGLQFSIEGLCFFVI
jgi:hypothetical protein